MFYRSAKWKNVPEKTRSELLTKDEDGEFWMSFEDVKKHFTDFEVCSVSVDELYEDDSGMYTHVLVYLPNPITTHL